MIRRALLTAIACLLPLVLDASKSLANDINWVASTGTPASFSDLNNWDLGRVPSESFSDQAIISNGGIVVVDSPSSAGTVQLGRSPGEDGTIIVSSGQTMNSSFSLGNSGGTGTLDIRAGAIVTGQAIVSDTIVDTQLIIDGTGAAPTIVEMENFIPNEMTTRIIGPNARFTLSSFVFTYAPSWVYIPEITGTTHSLIEYNGTGEQPFLIFGGVVRPQFSHGFVPSVGDSWVLAKWPMGLWDDNSQRPTLDSSLLPEGMELSLTSPEIAGYEQLLLTVKRLNPLSKPGDFDSDGVVGTADIDALSAQIRSGAFNSAYDLNGDAHLDDADRAVWVNELKKTYMGDANLDGQFDSADLVSVFQVGEYEDSVDANSGWGDGDFSGDGDFTSADFIVAFQAGGYDQGPRAGVSAVPEPASGSLAVIALSMMLGLICRRNR